LGDCITTHVGSNHISFRNRQSAPRLRLFVLLLLGSLKSAAQWVPA
jgi:hypothetical protein